MTDVKSELSRPNLATLPLNALEVATLRNPDGISYHLSPILVRRMLATIDALTKERDEARREALEEAAREVDCGCSCSADVLAAETSADRWRACSEGFCGALMARDIRALAEEE